MSLVYANVKAAVEAILDVGVLSPTTTPTEAHIRIWMYDAVTIMAELLPVEQLTWLMRTTTGTADAEHVISTLDASKVVSVVKNGVECIRVDRQELQRIKRVAPLMYNSASIAFAIGGGDADGGVTKIEFHPATSAAFTIKYLSLPLAAASWNDATNLVPPDTWLPAIVDYTVMKAREQDEEPEMSEQAMKRWQEKVQITLGGGTIGTKGA